MNRNRKPELPEGKSLPEVKRLVDPDLVTQTRRYKLITPLFGGGVETQKADPITVVRATEVRGQLRFWWRATRGGQFGGSLEKMKEAEEVIWGSAAGKDKHGKERPGPSGITVLVEKEKGHEGKPDHPFEVIPQRNNPSRPSIRANRDSDVHPYAAFPLQPEQRDAEIGMETKSVLADAQFRLTLVYPEKHEKEIEAALWAWETFGGLGARTRRGFGALQCIHAERKLNSEVMESKQLPLSSKQAIEFFITGMKQHVSTGKWPEGVPHLERKGANYRLAFDDGVVQVWKNLIDALKDFRQDRRDGKSKNQPGRSYWPEPEAIRRLTRQRDPDHDPLGPKIDAFPRARFGLPIIFHFKDSNNDYPDDPNSDPADTTLQGVGKLDRMASPLILKPLAYGNKDRAIGLAAVLKAPLEPPGGLRLKTKKDDYQVSADVTDVADRIEPLGGIPDVLQAFLHFLKS